MSAQFQQMKRIVVTVATPGTAVPLSATPLFVRSFIAQAHFQNTGQIFIGDSPSNAASANAHAIGAGNNFAIGGDMERARTVQLDLSAIYIDTDIAGSKFIVTYLADELHQ